jgi:predicted helicase
MFSPAGNNCESRRGERCRCCRIRGTNQGVSRYRYAENGKRVDNITDWALTQFRNHYEKGKKPKRAIDKDAIFHYVYGVLHDPVYEIPYQRQRSPDCTTPRRLMFIPGGNIV